MKFICDKKHFLKIINANSLIIKSKMSFAHLSNILIEACVDEIIIKASNGDLSQIARIEAEVLEVGKIVLSQQRLLNLLKQIPDGSVSFSVSENNLIDIHPVNSKRRLESRLLGLPADDFIELPVYPENEPGIALDKSYFKRMIQKVAFLADAHAGKYALNGILLEFKDNKINLVATDSRRLAVFTTSVNDVSKENIKLILSQDLLNHLQRLFVLDGSLSFCYKDGFVFFKFDEFMVSATLINGEYPNYEVFLPKKNNYSLGCKIGELLEAMNLGTSLLEGDPTHKLVFSLKKDELEVSAKVAEYGDVKEKISVSYKQEPIKIGFNAKMTLEILRQIDTEEVDFFFNNENSPVVVRERNRNEYVYVVMPIKLREDI